MGGVEQEGGGEWAGRFLARRFDFLPRSSVSGLSGVSAPYYSLSAYTFLPPDMRACLRIFFPLLADISKIIFREYQAGA